MFERYYSFFHYCLLSCRDVMFHKRILSKPKWGAQAGAKGHAPFPPPPHVARALDYAYCNAWAQNLPETPQNAKQLRPYFILLRNIQLSCYI